VTHAGVGPGKAGVEPAASPEFGQLFCRAPPSAATGAHGDCRISYRFAHPSREDRLYPERRSAASPGHIVRLVLGALLLLLLAAALCAPLGAHDLFVVLDRFQVAAGRPLRVALVNGTFALSENVVERERLRTIVLAAEDSARELSPLAWTEQGETTYVDLPAPPAGTIVLGVSLYPATITLAGEDFDAYLVEEGLEEVRAVRDTLGIAGDGARERYAKHAKAIVRVGDSASTGWDAVLGFPAELVPLADPTLLKVGDTLRVRALADGAPAPGLALRAGWRPWRGAVGSLAPLRTDSAGVASIPLDAAGRWYVKTIALERSEEPGLDYESQWATLTFELGTPPPPPPPPRRR
jgi:hypothetical protein